MRIAVFSLLLIATISTAFAQKKSKVLENKIKLVTESKEDYDIAKGRTITDGYNAFDRNGNLIEERKYDKYGRETERITYEYNSDNQKTKETSAKPNGTINKIEEYKYKDGLKSEKITYYGNGKIKSRKKYNYTFYE